MRQHELALQDAEADQQSPLDELERDAERTRERVNDSVVELRDRLGLDPEASHAHGPFAPVRRHPFTVAVAAAGAATAAVVGVHRHSRPPQVFQGAAREAAREAIKETERRRKAARKAARRRWSAAKGAFRRGRVVGREAAQEGDAATRAPLRRREATANRRAAARRFACPRT